VTRLSLEGKFRPKRGGVNCKGRDRESKRCGISAFGFEKNASSIYVEHSCRLESSP